MGRRIVVLAVLVCVVSAPAAGQTMEATWCTSSACVQAAKDRAREERREHRAWVRTQWALPCVVGSCPGVQRRYWRRERRALGAATSGFLASLRGCETRGKPFPTNYRWRGLFRGAYQFDFRTWGEAGGSGDPADAIPAEQDVRTARFYPGHESRWPNCP